MKKCKVLLVLPLLIFSSCAKTNPSPDKELINKFYQNFLMLTEIPRPSKHEKRISDFLKSWSFFHILMGEESLQALENFGKTY